MTSAGRAAALALALAAVVPAVSARAADAPAAPADFEALSEAVAPAIVSLKVVYTWGSGEEEDTWWSHGAVVDASGLVVVGVATGSDGRVKIKSVHALFGNDPKEWPAVLVAKDTNLGLSWVQVLGLEGKAVAHVDLARAVTAREKPPRLGEPLFGVTRLGRGFDYAPSARRLYFTSRIDSPRRMWDFTGDFGEAGLPVFDMAGRPVALLAEQASAEGAGEDGGQSSETFALPLDVVVKSLEMARARVPDALRKAEGAAKDAPKKDDGKAAGPDGAPAPPREPPEAGSSGAPKPPDGPK